MRTFTKKLMAALLMAVLLVPGFAPPARTANAAGSEKQIQILATSDLHGKFLPYDYATNEESTLGSLAQAAAIIKEKRNANTILVDVGDTIESNSASLFFDETVHPMIAGFNLLNYDFWAAGNHEFNYGVETLLKTADQFKGTFLCGNVYDSTGKALGESYKIVERDGVKIAVIGYVTPNITRWDADHLKNYKVTNPLDEMKTAVSAAEKEADVIVAALHMGVEGEFDTKGTGAEDIAEAFPEIDVILAAHGHEERNEEKNGVLIIENKSQGQTLADVDITVRPDGKGGYEVTDAKAEICPAGGAEADAEMVKALSAYDERAKADAVTVVGELKGGDLVPEAEIPGITQSQIEETAMLNLINQVQLYYGNAEVSAAAAFSPSANMKEGKIRKCDNALIYKYDNTLYRLEMTGKQLKQYMEWSAAYYNTYRDGDLTISFNEDMRSYFYDMFAGVKYDINISKKPGKRIENLTRMDGTKIRDTDKLTVAVNNYRASSQLLTYGSVYSEEKGDTLPKLLEKDIMAGETVRSMIGKWITEKNKGVIYPELSGNWKITGNNWNEGLHKKAAELIKAGKITLPISSDGRTPNIKSITVDDIKDYVSIARVTMNANGGKAGTKTLYVQKSKAYGTLPGAVRAGYNFDGWYTKKNGGKKVNAKTKAVSGTLYAGWSKVTPPAAPQIKTLKAGRKSLTVSFDKIKGAKGYKIYYSTDKTFKKNVKTLTAAKADVTIKKLTDKKTYYIKVRAFRTDSTGAKIYGKAGTSKKITVK